MAEKKKATARDRPDAILFPDGMKRGRTFGDRLTWVQDKFGRVLAGPDYQGIPTHTVWVNDALYEGGMRFARLEHNASMLFPQDHPTMPKRPRYDWVDQPDGTKFGYLKDDEPEDEEA